MPAQPEPRREGEPARHTFDDLLRVMAELRGPQGCPWDRAQTPQSLRPFLLEEAYELLDALDRDDAAAIREELGDLLLQVVFQSQLAAEAGRFDARDVVEALVRKLITRHPHVFGGERLETADEVLAHWYAAKRSARREPFEGIPRALPALAAAQKVLERAGELGFRWPDARAAAEQVRAEVAEVEEAAGPARAAEEVGDLLLAAVALAVLLRVDAEQALRDATRRFVERFARAQALAAAEGAPLESRAPAEMLAYWERAKR